MSTSCCCHVLKVRSCERFCQDFPADYVGLRVLSMDSTQQYDKPADHRAYEALLGRLGSACLGSEGLYDIVCSLAPPCTGPQAFGLFKSTETAGHMHHTHGRFRQFMDSSIIFKMDIGLYIGTMAPNYSSPCMSTCSGLTR